MHPKLILLFLFALTMGSERLVSGLKCYNCMLPGTNDDDDGLESCFKPEFIVDCNSQEDAAKARFQLNEAYRRRQAEALMEDAEMQNKQGIPMSVVCALMFVKFGPLKAKHYTCLAKPTCEMPKKSKCVKMKFEKLFKDVPVSNNTKDQASQFYEGLTEHCFCDEKNDDRPCNADLEWKDPEDIDKFLACQAPATSAKNAASAKGATPSKSATQSTIEVQSYFIWLMMASLLSSFWYSIIKS